jgi:hypothetical protein
MPTKRIGDLPKPKYPFCTHPEHNPPSHWAPHPGLYEHTCPSCGHTIQFVVGGVLMSCKAALSADDLWDLSHPRSQ